MEDEFNAWKELADHGLTRPDQVEDMKNWLAVRQAALDQMRKAWEARYPMSSPAVNMFRLDQMECGQFRLDIDKWQLQEFLDALENETPN